jgi:hypothetical protein
MRIPTIIAFELDHESKQLREIQRKAINKNMKIMCPNQTLKIRGQRRDVCEGEKTTKLFYFSRTRDDKSEDISPKGIPGPFVEKLL